MNKKKCTTAVKKHKQNYNSKNQSNDELVTIALICDNCVYRMKSYGPSPLIQFKKHKLLDIQINAIKKAFKNFEIILSTGYETDKISKYIKSRYKNINIRIVENQLFDKFNSCESLRLILNNTNNTKILICDGSLIFNHDTLKLLNFNESCVYIEKSHDSNMSIGVNINEDNNIEHFAFGASQPWAEMIFLHNNETVENLRKLISNEEYKYKFIFEGLNDWLQSNHKLNYILNTKQDIIKINNIKTYHEIKENY